MTWHSIDIVFSKDVGNDQLEVTERFIPSFRLLRDFFFLQKKNEGVRQTLFPIHTDARVKQSLNFVVITSAVFTNRAHLTSVTAIVTWGMKRGTSDRWRCDNGRHLSDMKRTKRHMAPSGEKSNTIRIQCIAHWQRRIYIFIQPSWFHNSHVFVCHVSVGLFYSKQYLWHKQASKCHCLCHILDHFVRSIPAERISYS